MLPSTPSPARDDAGPSRPAAPRCAVLRCAAQGKVRDTYDLGDKLVIVTTDRQSAFDRLLAAVPFKGQVGRAGRGGGGAVPGGGRGGMLRGKGQGRAG